jgi:hypothetical protein
MSFGKFIWIPVFVAFQAFTMMIIAPYIPGSSKAVGAGLVTWVSFQAWAMYFLAGGTIKMGFKTLVGYFGGVVASVAIFEIAALLGGLNTATTPWGLYLAVFLVVVPVIAAQKVPGIDFVPSYFLGAGVFFALMTYLQKPEGLSRWGWYAALTVPEMIACAVGLVYGWVTITFQTFYTARVGGEEAKPAEA